ncbi:hypothetical protein QNJ80_45165 (plasmid) [Bradyrhizobium elkanii]|jgi:hypothetical protein|nr:hypothetical protein [Bradyrhizobium elkanii]WLB05148.1 hypothetical protein QNJ80_45165 [Bradyrhizobium elkanii]
MIDARPLHMHGCAIGDRQQFLHVFDELRQGVGEIEFASDPRVGVIRPFNCGLLSSYHSFSPSGTPVAIAPSELVRIADDETIAWRDWITPTSLLASA